MKGDFSRGHQPDRKRGREYRRVLLQQGRLLLDSDVASLVDAVDGQLRDLADIGCPEGSPDYGFLITPGRLLGIFDEIEDIVSQAAGTVEFYRDYSHKYLDRTPSLFLGATAGVAGTARVRIRGTASGDVDFWVRSDAATAVTVNGVALNVPANAAFQRVTINLGGAPVQDLDVALDPGEQVWIGLIEETHATPLTPEFSVASGLYFLHGLILRNPADGYWPGVSYPAAAFPAFPDFTFLDPMTALVRGLQLNDRVVAYLEGWERHITRIEDAGIFEIALGTGPDTCTRTQAVGQVKLAYAGALTPDQIIGAFHARMLTDGTLVVTTPPAPVDPDPCALPTVGGYTGPDNRLYRFEVQSGGPLFGSFLKWSRDNASELFATRAATNTALTFRAGSGLLAGDLVEVLSEHTDLADATVGVISGAPSFTAPDRAVGVLARLVEAPSVNADEESFTLVDPEDESLPVVLTLADFGDPLNPALKVRRWHGVVRPAGADPFVIEIEDGIEISLTGTFTPGDFWLYEARVAGTQANGPWQATPHGPERFFTPLALLEFNGVAAPLELIAWLDDRFSPVCELNADDIAFDGDRIGTDSDTVQEVIEELWERERGGCCDHTLEPNADELAARINAILASTTGDVVICLRRGVYPMSGEVLVAGRRVTIHGCPAAVISYTNDAIPFVAGPQGHIVLEELTVLVESGAGAPTIVELGADSVGLTARAVGFISAAPFPQQVSIRIAGQGPSIPAPGQPMFPPDLGFFPLDGPSVDAEDCVFVAAWAMSGASAGSLRFVGCSMHTAVGGVQCSTVGSSQFERSAISTGLNLAFTDAWTAGGLLANPDSLLGGLASAGVVAGQGLACLHGSYWINTRVEDCGLRGPYGIAIAGADRAHCEGNHYRCAESAIYFAATRSAHIHSETLGGGGAPQTSIGVHIPQFIREAAIITDCELDGCRDGIVIQEDAGRTPVPLFDSRIEGLMISGNTITASRMGIVVGSMNKQPGEVSGVRIEQNHVQATEFGIVLRRVLEGQQPPAREIRVGENTVTSLQCLYVDFAPCIVEDNRFLFQGGVGDGPASPAAYLNQALNLVLSSNVFELAADSPAPQPVVIQLDGGSDAFILDNTVSATPRTFAIIARQHGRLQVTGNNFGSSDCQIQQCPDLRFDGNQAGAVSVSSSASASVRSNRLEELNAASLSGQWQVNDNRASGRISLVPSLTGGLVFLPGVFTTATYERAINAINTLGGGAVVERTLIPDVGGAGPRAIAADAAVNANWAGDWTDAVTGVAIGNLGHLPLGDLVAGVSVVNLHETVYQAQVVGNWCRLLQVGLGGEATVRGTVVVVTSNRATDQLLVTNYLECVVSHNASPNMPGWLVSAPGNHLVDRNIRE